MYSLGLDSGSSLMKMVKYYGHVSYGAIAEQWKLGIMPLINLAKLYLKVY